MVRIRLLPDFFFGAVIAPKGGGGPVPIRFIKVRSTEPNLEEIAQ